MRLPVHCEYQCRRQTITTRRSDEIFLIRVCRTAGAATAPLVDSPARRGGTHCLHWRVRENPPRARHTFEMITLHSALGLKQIGVDELAAAVVSGLCRYGSHPSSSSRWSVGKS